MPLSPSPPSRLGRWIVLAILAVGLVGGMISVLYWRGQMENENVAPIGAQTPDDAQAQRKLDDLSKRADVALAHDQAAPLIPEAQAFVAQYPTMAGGHLLLAQLYINEKRAKEGLDQLELCLQYDPRQPKVEELAGVVAQSLGLSDKALHHYGMAMSLSPGNARLHVFLAQAYIQKRDFDQARMTLLQALQIDSHLHEAYFALAGLDASQGNLPQAITQIRRALDEVPVDDLKHQLDYIRFLATLLRRDNRPEESLQTLQRLPPDECRSPLILNDMSECWAMMGQPKKGAQLFEDAMNHQPLEWRLPAGAAMWYLRAGDKADARRMCDLVRSLNPSADILPELDQKLNAPDTRPAVPPASRPEAPPAVIPGGLKRPG